MTHPADNDKELIQRYLLGQTTAEENDILQSRIVAEPEFAYDVQVEKSLIAAAGAAGGAALLRGRMQNMKAQYVKPSKIIKAKHWFMAAGIISCVAWVLWIWQSAPEITTEIIPSPAPIITKTSPPAPVETSPKPEVDKIETDHIPEPAKPIAKKKVDPDWKKASTSPAPTPLPTPAIVSGTTARTVNYLRVEKKEKRYLFDGNRLQLLGDFDIPSGKMLIKKSWDRYFFEYKGLYYEVKFTDSDPQAPVLIHDIQLLAKIKREKPADEEIEIIFPHIYAPGHPHSTINITIEPLGPDAHYRFGLNANANTPELTLYGEYFTTPIEVIYTEKLDAYHLILGGTLYRLEAGDEKEKLKRERNGEIISVFEYSKKMRP